MRTVVDGLDALRVEIGVAEVASLIERTARWVDPATFDLLPVWFPEHGRGHKFYKGRWSEPQMNTRRNSGTTTHKVEGNIYANQALTLALGLRKSTRPNWSCCHIWGLDDPGYQKSNAVMQDRRFYSCVGNMVLLADALESLHRHHAGNKGDASALQPVPLWLAVRPQLAGKRAFGPGVVVGLERLSEKLAPFGQGGIPLGTVPLDAGIRKSAADRLAAIRSDLTGQGCFYPKEEVLAVLAYWKIPASPPTAAS